MREDHSKYQIRFISIAPCVYTHCVHIEEFREENVVVSFVFYLWFCREKVFKWNLEIWCYSVSNLCSSKPWFLFISFAFIFLLAPSPSPSLLPLFHLLLVFHTRSRTRLGSIPKKNGPQSQQMYTGARFVVSTTAFLLFLFRLRYSLICLLRSFFISIIRCVPSSRFKNIIMFLFAVLSCLFFCLFVVLIHWAGCCWSPCTMSFHRNALKIVGQECLGLHTLND